MKWILLLTVLVLSPVSQAEINKCADKNGKLYLTDKPCPAKYDLKETILSEAEKEKIALEQAREARAKAEAEAEELRRKAPIVEPSKVVAKSDRPIIPTPSRAASLTPSQINAVRSARQYLLAQGFSRIGLIEQLSSDYGSSYKVSDATAAVDSLNVNWNSQAIKSAKQYLILQGFSCNGLIEQLSSSAGDQYTFSQATYGAQQAGACE